MNSMNHMLIFVLLILQVTLLSCKNKATILYFNDAHEISPVTDQLGSRGGIARLKSVIDDIRIINPDAIVVFGGDLAGGSLFGAVYHGLPMVEAFNLLPLDIANFGQHDFDFGVKNSRQLIEQSNFNWISSNLAEESGQSFANVPRYLIKPASGIRIGFIGLTDAMDTTTPTEEVKQLDILSSARAAIDSLKYHNIEFIVAITQMSMEKNEQLLKDNPLIDLILTEERYEDKSSLIYLGNRPIITPCGNMGSIIQVDIERDGESLPVHISVHPVDNTIPEDPLLLNVQKIYQDSLNHKLAESIAEVLTDLDAGINSNFNCRWQESNLGNLITDAYRENYKADIAVINGGGIRANIPAGDLTLKDAFSALPFGNRICLISVQGKTIRKMLEHGVSNVEARDGSFLQVSGIHYSYAIESTTGNRVKSIKVNHKTLLNKKYYTLALPDFILNGGNGFSMLRKSERIITPEHTEQDVDIFIAYCKGKKVIDYKTEGRIHHSSKNNEEND